MLEITHEVLNIKAAASSILNFSAVLTHAQKKEKKKKRNCVSVFWCESLILIFYLLKKAPICVCVWVNLDLRALAVNGAGQTVESPATETGRAQSNDERRHIHMRVNTMFPHTLSTRKRAWLCENFDELKDFY